MRRLSTPHARVSAEVPIDRWGLSPRVVLTPAIDGDVELTFTAMDARATARKLKQMADVIDPPKRRNR